MHSMAILHDLALVAALAVFALAFFLAIWFPLTHLVFVRYHRRRGLEPAPMGVGEALSYYWRTTVAYAVMAWWMVRAAGRGGLRRPAGEASGPPVLCVHGFLRNGTCTWGLRRALERGGRPTLAVSMGRPFRRLRHYVTPVAAALRELTVSYPGTTIDVVAHSLGGIVLRRTLAEHPDLAASVGRIVTLGSPHRGTGTAYRTPLAPETRHLHPGSTTLGELPDFAVSAPRAEVITIAAVPDFIVYPQSTSHLPGSRAVDFPGVSHPGLLTERAVIDYVVKALGAGDASSRRAAR